MFSVSRKQMIYFLFKYFMDLHGKQYGEMVIWY